MLPRRHFLAAAALLSLGCPQRPPRKSGVKALPTDPATLARLREQRAARLAHVAALTKRPPPPGPVTPPGVDVAALIADFPKTLLRVTHRLHPRFDPAVAATDSHLGGPLLWAEGEPWPGVPGTDWPLVPVMQLKLEDAPPQARFKGDADLVQLFLSPRFADKLPRLELHPRVYWRRRQGLTPAVHPLAAVGLGAPGLDDAAFERLGLWTDYVPAPCRLTPEKVIELPSWDVLPEQVRPLLRERVPGGEAAYRAELSAAAGTKVGGYPPHQPDGKPPACPSCRRATDYLLTIGERPTAPRWATPAGGDPGLQLGPTGGVHVFVCRLCPDWPAAVVG